MKDEEVKLSNTYKRAYNHADMICRYMPERIDSLHKPKNEDPEYTKGFEDRLRQYKREIEATKQFSFATLEEKYTPSTNKSKKEKKQGKIIAPKFKR